MVEWTHVNVAIKQGYSRSFKFEHITSKNQDKIVQKGP